MSILNSINQAREKGVSDKDILQEIIKQNPDKESNFQEALKRGATYNQVLEEIIKQNIQKEEEIKKQEAKALIMEKLKQKPSLDPVLEEEKKPLPPQKPASEKQWVRLIIFLVLFISLIGFGTFWYWYLIIRQQPPIPPEIKLPIDYILQEDCEQAGYYWYDQSCHQEEEVIIYDLEKVSELITNVLSLKRPIGSFEEIKFEEISFLQIMQALEINFPELLGKLENPTFFIYSQEQGNRVGFKGLTREDLTELMLGKETDLLNIFKNLFQVIGFEQEPISTIFKQAIDSPAYDGPNFRYQTLTQDDFGLVYYVSDDQFIFSTSWQSLEYILNKEKETKEEPALQEQIIKITFQEGTGQETISLIIDSIQGEIINVQNNTFYVMLSVASDQDLENIIEQFKSYPEVILAELETTNQ